jgi:hypothetical protein
MTSLGNVEATPLASLTVISFTTGDILYLTGSASNLFGDPANAIMPFQQRVTTIRVDGYTFVEDALPVRQRPGSEVERSPYSPPVRLLADEMGEGTLSDAGKVHALLKSIVVHSTNIATFVWELVTPPELMSSTDPPAPPRVSIRPGQAAVLDFTPLLGQPAYQHMAPLKPTSINDDRIRTWTISSCDAWSEGTPGGNTAQTFELTMREKPGGTVTGALFTLARKLVSVGRKDLLDNMKPLDIQVGFVGVSGEFVLPKTIGAEEIVGGAGEAESGIIDVQRPTLYSTPLTTTMKRRLLWAAGGIGITPFLAMLNGLVSSSNPDSSSAATAVSWCINLVLSTREPEVMIPLLEESLWRMRPSAKTPGMKMKIKLVVDVFSQRSIPDLQETGDGEDEENEWVKVELRRHSGRMGKTFFEGLAKGEDGNGVGLEGTEAYVCGPEEFEKMVMDAVVMLGVERGKIRREGFAY